MNTSSELWSRMEAPMAAWAGQLALLQAVSLAVDPSQTRTNIGSPIHVGTLEICFPIQSTRLRSLAATASPVLSMMVGTRWWVACLANIFCWFEHDPLAHKRKHLLRSNDHNRLYPGSVAECAFMPRFHDITGYDRSSGVSVCAYEREGRVRTNRRSAKHAAQQRVLTIMDDTGEGCSSGRCRRRP